MKKGFRVFSLVLAMLFALQVFALAYAAQPVQMQVTITAECYDENGVGDEWYEYYELNGYEMFSGDYIDFALGDTFELFSQITERDVLSDDIGTCAEYYEVNRAMLTNGFTIDQYLTVTEDSGRYKGYWCEWYIHFDFIPVY